MTAADPKQPVRIWGTTAPMNLRKTVFILIGVAFLGIVAIVIAPGFPDEDLDDPILRASAEIRVLETALKFYRLDIGHFPSTEHGLSALVRRPNDSDSDDWLEGGYLARLPKDPWGRDYLYENPGRLAEIDVFTLGRDGLEGGDGMDATIGNWNLQD